MKELSLKRIAIGAAAALLLVPSAASAGPSKADRGEAAKECRQFLNAAGNRENLGRIFGTNRSNAVRKCRAVQARDAAKERKGSAREAVETCKASRPEGQTLGECVSAERRRLNAEEDREDRERIAAVRACKENEATSTGRAFGECVSNAQSDGRSGEGSDNSGSNSDAGEQHATDGQANADGRRPDGVPPTRP